MDIVGVKPGMTPKEVREAFTHYNPSLTILEINTRLMDPLAIGHYQRVPLYLIARTVNRAQPDIDTLPDRSAESISVEFTTPPGPPVADRISRWVQFPQGKPVTVKTLLEAMEKKYGPANGQVGGTNKTWTFSTDGQLLTQVAQTARLCTPDLAGFPMFRTANDGRDYGDVSLQNTIPAPTPLDYSAGCGQFMFVSAANLSLSLDTPLQEMQVYLESGALYTRARAATHQWLQALADGKSRAEAAAAAARAAPVL
jgi:hypothetical protein